MSPVRVIPRKYFERGEGDGFCERPYEGMKATAVLYHEPRPPPRLAVRLAGTLGD
jgi:hypothetical protein